jgi:hypothetical protein
LQTTSVVGGSLSNPIPVPTGRALYTPQALAACELALRTLIAKIGRWAPQVVVIGGLVPKYLIGDVPEGLEPHIGTTDIDVVIGVMLPADDEPLYTTLEAKLLEAGFQQAVNKATGQRESFRWERSVNGIGVALEFFCPAGDGPAGRLKRRPQGQTGSRISAFRLRGAELAGRDNISITLAGPTLDHGGTRQVSIRVANLLPFLVLKAFALDGRDKDKDSYDIVWTLNTFGDGPLSAVAAAARSSVSNDPDVAAAMKLLRDLFHDLDGAGPSLYARFLIGQANDPDQRAQLQRFAQATVRTFLDAWERREKSYLL